MSFQFTESERALSYEEREGRSALRHVAAGAGLIAFVSSWIFIELIRQTKAPYNAAKLGGMAASVLGLLAFWFFGGYCFKIAFFIPLQTVLFDRERREVVYTRRSPARPARETRYPFSAISLIEVVAHDPEDGPKTFTVVMTITSVGTQPLSIQMGVFPDAVQADERRAQVQRVVGPSL